MKNIFIVLSLLTLVSCETINGSLEVVSTITLKDSKRRSVQINEGVHNDSKIKLKSKKRLKLVVDGTTFEFKIPKSARIPTNNGTIFLESSDVSQPYDISGEVQTEVTHGDMRRNREQCSWQEPYTVCQTDQNGRRVCRTEYRTTYGWKTVEYHDDLINKELDVSLLLPGTSTEAARFSGKESWYQRIVDYESRCF